MTEVPETRYAKTVDGVHIAYQMVGEGPITLVYMQDWATHVEMLWEDPANAAFCERLASFSRLVLFDKRGVGLSDPISVPHLPTLESWMDDVITVLDTVAVERAVLFGAGSGALIAMLSAAAWPSRTTALVVCNGFARVRRAGDYPHGLPETVAQEFIDATMAARGSWPYELSTLPDPSVVSDPARLAWLGRYSRATWSPGVMEPMLHLIVDSDLRAILPTIRVPTLVLHRAQNQFIRVAHGRYLAEHIPGVRYVELAGADNSPEFGDADSVLDEVQEFLTGVRPPPAGDRVLTTVVFTDIVNSTPLAAELGDHRWRELLGRHDDAVRRQLARFRGTEVKTTGDGFMATFDGPARAVHCAAAIRDAARALGIEVRAGVHTGEVERHANDLAGIAVHIGARVSALARAGEVLVSSTVKDLVAGSGITFEDRGVQMLKGVPDKWHLYRVVS